MAVARSPASLQAGASFSAYLWRYSLLFRAAPEVDIFDFTRTPEAELYARYMDKLPHNGLVGLSVAVAMGSNAAFVAGGKNESRYVSMIRYEGDVMTNY